VDPEKLSSKGMSATVEDAVKTAVNKFQEYTGLPVTGSFVGAILSFIMHFYLNNQL
jgi:hypothetical protein